MINTNFKIALANLDLEYPIDKWPSKKQSIGLGYISAVLKKEGFGVDLYDCRATHSPVQIREALLGQKYNLIGLSFTGLELSKNFIEEDNLQAALTNNVTKLVREIKLINPAAKIILGGYSATFWAKEILEAFPFIDFICLGEGELTMLSLARSLSSGGKTPRLKGLAKMIKNKYVAQKRSKLPNLDKLPLPDRPKIDPAEWVTVNSSRGCYAHCLFCSTFSFYNEPKCNWWRGRSSSSVVNEILFLNKNYGITKVHFADDNFISNDPKRAKRIIEGILKNKLRIKLRFDCRVNEVLSNPDIFYLLKELEGSRVYLGCESGHQKTLDFFRKGVTVDQNIKAVNFFKRLGIDVNPGLIMFHPFNTLEEFEDNIKFCEAIGGNPTLPMLTSELFLYKGTPIYRYCQEKKLLINPLLGKYIIIDNRARQVKDYYLNFYATKVTNIDTKIYSKIRAGIIDFSLGKILNQIHFKAFKYLLKCIRASETPKIITGSLQKFVREVREVEKLLP